LQQDAFFFLPGEEVETACVQRETRWVCGVLVII